MTSKAKVTLNEAHGQALKLAAMLAMTYGDNGECFRDTSPDTQDMYLWACSDLVRSLASTLEAVDSALGSGAEG